MPALDTIQFRNGTAAAWTSANPVLALGEPGWENDTGKSKVGDGVTAWASLPYVGSGTYVPAGSPGLILASHFYPPVGTGEIDYTINTGNIPTILDSTNLTVAFTVPPSGNFLVDVSINFFYTTQQSGGTYQSPYLLLLKHGQTDLANIVGPVIALNQQSSGSSFFSDFQPLTRFPIKGSDWGLTPGQSLQLDLAAMVTGTPLAAGFAIANQATAAAVQADEPGPCSIVVTAL